MYIKRDLESSIASAISSRKVLVVYGSRQTGKTTLIEHVLSSPDFQLQGVVSLSGDIKKHRDWLNYETMTVEKAKSLIGTAKVFFIDEAQKILNIGLTLKIIHDALKDVRIFATESSSFELSEEVGEPLTGRMASYVLDAFSFHELAANASNAVEVASLDARLRLGAYPDVVLAESEKAAIENLEQLCEAYLFRDIFKWNNLKHSEMLDRLLKALALQLGDEVSYREVGSIVGVDNETVSAYVERLEKAFVLFRLPAFARNKRNELKKSRKIYFRDVGIRNAVLGNYLPLDSRDDVGHLFENYLIAERFKTNNMQRRRVKGYFWRTTSPADGEVDYVEESADGLIRAYEFKYNPAKARKAKCPAAFARAYPMASWTVVSREDYIPFVMGEV